MIRETSSKAGTVSLGMLESPCQPNVFLRTAVEPMLQVGCKDLTLPKQKELSLVKFAITGVVNAVIGATTFVYSTVAVSTCMSWTKPLNAVFVTVATDFQVRIYFKHSYQDGGVGDAYFSHSAFTFFAVHISLRCILMAKTVLITACTKYAPSYRVFIYRVNECVLKCHSIFKAMKTTKNPYISTNPLPTSKSLYDKKLSYFCLLKICFK